MNKAINESCSLIRTLVHSSRSVPRSVSSQLKLVSPSCVLEKNLDALFDTHETQVAIFEE